MNAYGAVHHRGILGQTQDQNLQQMIDIQKRINALADSVPPGTIPKEQLDSVTAKLEQCRSSAGTAQGVQCALQAEAEFKALVEAHRPSGAPVWPWLVGGAVAVGAAVLLLSSGGRRR